jgi:hypothetical protein
VALGNSGDRLWTMTNGYAMTSHDGLIMIGNRLRAASESERDALRQLLRIGVQWNTQVTINDCRHTVTQAYCSALPVAYSRQSADLWGEFARLVLEASYEATLCAAILNSRDNGTNRVFLTLLGGGAFGNATDWIMAAITRALTLHADRDLDVVIVSYGGSKACVRQLVDQFSRER